MSAFSFRNYDLIIFHFYLCCKLLHLCYSAGISFSFNFISGRYKFVSGRYRFFITAWYNFFELGSSELERKDSFSPERMSLFRWSAKGRGEILTPLSASSEKGHSFRTKPIKVKKLPFGHLKRQKQRKRNLEVMQGSSTCISLKFLV